MIPIVVVIDSGIDSTIVKNETIDILHKGKDDKCGHGTACAMAIKAMDPDVSILSIPILDDSAGATSDELENALKFCCGLDCNIINLSLSVSHLHSENLKRICGELRRQGKIIVSSVTNRKYTSVPASYDTVLGVRGKVFSSSYTYWFNARKKIQLITDMTPIFTDFRLKRYFMFSGNSKAAAIASGLIASYFSNGLIEDIEELSQCMEQKCEKNNWGKITLESQMGNILVPSILTGKELENIRKMIYPLLKRHITSEQDFSDNDVLFNVGIITEKTLCELFEALSNLFNVEINLQNLTPRDIVSINNLSIAIKRICNEQGK